MGQVSAGIVLYRRCGRGIEVLLGHPADPLWRGQDPGAWIIPQEDFVPDDNRLAAAVRHFEQLAGFPPRGPYLPLLPARQEDGKVVYAWACEGGCDPQSIPGLRAGVWGADRWWALNDVDQARWFSLEAAVQKIQPGQRAILEEMLLRWGRDR